MARMYKSRKGQSGSTRPHVKEAPEWSNTDKDAVQSLILDLAKTGMSTAEFLNQAQDDMQVAAPAEYVLVCGLMLCLATLRHELLGVKS